LRIENTGSRAIAPETGWLRQAALSSLAGGAPPVSEAANTHAHARSAATALGASARRA
jgi:hypothetical protein